MGAYSLDKADDSWWADSVHHGNDKQTLRPLRRAYEEVVAANLALPIGVPTPVSMILLPLCAHVCVVSVCLCTSLSMCVCARVRVRVCVRVAVFPISVFPRAGSGHGEALRGRASVARDGGD